MQKQIGDLQNQINSTAQSLKISEEIKDDLLRELDNLRGKSDIKIFNGIWKIKYKNQEDNVMIERITISNGDISYSNAEAKYELLFKIKICAYNPNSNELIFLFQGGKDSKISRFSEILRPQGQNITFLKNYEENSTILELERITS